MRCFGWVCLLVLAGAVAAAPPELDAVDRMVAAGIVRVRAGQEANAPAGYGLVCSVGAVVVVPNELLGATEQPLLELDGHQYQATKLAGDVRGLALVRVPADNVHTIPLGSADSVQVGASVRTLMPDAGGWKRLTGKVVSNGVQRLRRAKIRVLEVDLPPDKLPAGLPLYSADTGQVVGIVAAVGPASPVNLRAAAVDTASSLLIGAGVELKANLATDTAAVVGADGRLLDRLVNTWSFQARDVGLGAAVRRSMHYWQSIYGRYPDPLTQPVLDRGQLFFADWGGALCALETKDQRRCWASNDPQLMAFHPPLVGDDVVAQAVGWIAPTSWPDYGDLAGQYDMWQQQAKVGGSLAELGQAQRRVFGKDPLTLDQRRLHFAVHGVGAVVGLDRTTGRERWRLPTGFLSRPLLAGDRFYFGGLGLYGAATLNDGGMLWVVGQHYGKAEPTRTTWWHPAYAAKDKVYYLAVPVWYGDKQDDRLHASGECYLVEVDPATGAKRSEHNLFELRADRHNAERPLATFAVVDGAGTPRGTLFCLVGQNLFRVEPATGKATLLGEAPNANQDLVYSTEFAVADGVVYIGTSARQLLALDGHTGKPVWTDTPTLKGAVGSPLVHGGVVYVGSSDGFLHAFATADGRQLWWYEIGGKIAGQPVVATEGEREQLYATLDNGKVVSITLPQL